MNGETRIPIQKQDIQRAAELARQCSSAVVRERVLVSRSAALALREGLERRFNLTTADGRSSQLNYVELLDICDFLAGNWRIETRAMMAVEREALYMPTMPLMVGVLSDFYVCAQVDKDLVGVEVLGFARRADLAEADLSANGLFAILPLEELQSFDLLPAALKETRDFDSTQTRMFEEWQERAERIIRGFNEVLAAEGGAINPAQVERIAAGVRDDIWRVYGDQLPATGLEPLFDRVFRRFGVDRPVPASPASQITFQNRSEDQDKFSDTRTRAEFFEDGLNVGERIALYRYLLDDEAAMSEHRQIRRAFDHATRGKAQTSARRRERIASVNERRLRAVLFNEEAVAGGAVEEGEIMKAIAVKDSLAPELDFSASPEVVRLVAEAEQLSCGHLFNPTFATETSLVDPLPHQRIAVYEHMLNQWRLRFLLADDAGAGKTIMTGLYIREMLSRRLIRRVLIVPPAGLVGNWEREMRTLFGMNFRVVIGADAKSGNPFLSTQEQPNDLLIVSVDTLAGEKMFSRLQDSNVVPYDLVVFDESHKLSADRDQDGSMRKTDRYFLAESLAGVRTDDDRWRLDWSPRHLLLLTATPHMGKPYPYYCLWRLLEPDVLSTETAFKHYPADARQRHFIRRTKEEMVRFDGTPIYPKRISDTLSYDLAQGTDSEQTLYDETTSYIRTYYNLARILNRSAARLAMSVFQRRLASSTYAVMLSFERRLEKLNEMIELLNSGKFTEGQLKARQEALESTRDLLDQETADEEDYSDGREAHEIEEDRSLSATLTTALADLEVERAQVRKLLGIASKVHADEQGSSKFNRLCEILRDPRYRAEKMIIFTEHRDTLDFLVRRLEGIGYTRQVVRIHGGMDYKERDVQVELFRKPIEDGGARYLVATDAAGEGINLQFCWLMINYDIPWNPARLEQRMGRIHRYGQQHDPVVILNIVAGKTREGGVLKTLLDKLEKIRQELQSDKVFDVIGRVFEGISIKQYMEQVVEGDAEQEKIEREIEGKLTKEQIEALQARERRLYGDGGDVKRELPRLQANLEQERYYRMLPGYVRHFIEHAAPSLDIGISGDLAEYFSLHELKAGALDTIWPLLEAYPPEARERLAVERPRGKEPAVFLHPGEPVFDRLRDSVLARFSAEALKGSVFVDPTAQQPYLFHLALVLAKRQADASLPALSREETVAFKLVGIKQDESGRVEECPVEHLLLLRGGPGIPAAAYRLTAIAREMRTGAHSFALNNMAEGLADQQRRNLESTLAEREDFVRRGYDLQEAELAGARTRLNEKARAGNTGAKAGLTRIKDRQRRLSALRDGALAVLRREPELIVASEVEFLAHALVVPSNDPEDHKRFDARIEAVAVHEVRTFEEARGARIRDVSTPVLAQTAGLPEWPGFDLLSNHPSGEERAIEVKGRAGVGDIELTENEWVKACNLRDRYWLYVVYDCATPNPRLLRIQDPFRALIVRAKSGVVISEQEIFEAADVKW